MESTDRVLPDKVGQRGSESVEEVIAEEFIEFFFVIRFVVSKDEKQKYRVLPDKVGQRGAAAHL